MSSSKSTEFLKTPFFFLRRLLFGNGPILDRLTSEIESVQAERDRIQATGASGDPELEARIKNANDHLETARVAAASNHVNHGWKAVHGARRELIALRSTPELLLHAKQLEAECAKKLKGWRAKAAKDLLSPIKPDDPQTDLPSRVTETQEILNGHNDNHYHKQNYRQFQMLLLKWHLIVCIATILTISLSDRLLPGAKHWYDERYAVKTGRLASLIEASDTLLDREPGAAEAEELEAESESKETEKVTADEAERQTEAERDLTTAEPDNGNGLGLENTQDGAAGGRPSTRSEDRGSKPAETNPPSDDHGYIEASRESLLIAVLLFGWLGGSFSALMSLSSASTDRKIPEVIEDSRLTLLRPLTGAAGAFIIYLGLLAGFPVSGLISSPSILIFAVAAGFSERFAVNVVERVSGGD